MKRCRAPCREAEGGELPERRFAELVDGAQERGPVGTEEWRHPKLAEQGGKGDSSAPSHRVSQAPRVIHARNRSLRAAASRRGVEGAPARRSSRRRSSPLASRSSPWWTSQSSRPAPPDGAGSAEERSGGVTRSAPVGRSCARGCAVPGGLACCDVSPVRQARCCSARADCRRCTPSCGPAMSGAKLSLRGKTAGASGGDPTARDLGPIGGSKEKAHLTHAAALSRGVPSEPEAAPLELAEPEPLAARSCLGGACCFCSCCPAACCEAEAPPEAM